MEITEPNEGRPEHAVASELRDRLGAWCVLRYGYDFAPPHIIAICQSKTKAEELMGKVFEDDGPGLPWNGLCVHMLRFDEVINWENENRDVDVDA